MDPIDLRPRRLLIRTLLEFYNCKIRNLDNSMLIRFLMLKKYFPGSKPYKQIKEYLQKHGYQSYPCFLYLESKYAAFQRSMYLFFRFLQNEGVPGYQIVQYQNLLTEFFSWLTMNRRSIEHSDWAQAVDFGKSHGSANFKKIDDHISFIKAFSAYEQFSRVKKDTIGKSDPEIENRKMMVYQNHFVINQEHEALLQGLPYIEERNLRFLVYLAALTGLSCSTLLRIKLKDVNLALQLFYYTSDESGNNYLQIFDATSKKIFLKYLEVPSHSIYLISMPERFYSYLPREKISRILLEKEFCNLRLDIRVSGDFWDSLHLYLKNNTMARNYWVNSPVIDV